MAVLSNTTTTSDIDVALDIEMIANFNQEYDRLADILGVTSPEIIAAGTALYQYEVTGSLSDATVAEGDEVPLSKYEVEKTPIGEIELKPYRKLTTAQAVLKSGYSNAVLRTDKEMVKDVRSDIINKYFAFLVNGTSYAQGLTLQAALAQASAELDVKMEEKGDKADRVVHFINSYDIADYLATAVVTTQTVFGMTYIGNFLGVTDLFVTSKVPKGTVYVTPAENIHMYGVDFGSLAQAGLSYTTYDSSLIGVNHQPVYNRVSAETNVLSGATLLAEITTYIVKARIGKALVDMSVDELKAYCDAYDIDYDSATTAAAILAIIEAAQPGAK